MERGRGGREREERWMDERNVRVSVAIMSTRGRGTAMIIWATVVAGDLVGGEDGGRSYRKLVSRALRPRAAMGPADRLAGDARGPRDDGHLLALAVGPRAYHRLTEERNGADAARCHWVPPGYSSTILGGRVKHPPFSSTERVSRLSGSSLGPSTGLLRSRVAAQHVRPGLAGTCCCSQADCSHRNME